MLRNRKKPPMPKIFVTLFWAGAASIAVSIVCGLFLPTLFTQWVLQLGLTGVLCFFVGVGATVLVLNEFQLKAARRGDPCVHTVESLGWFVGDMVGPKTNCGYLQESPSPSGRHGSLRTSIDDYEIKPG